MTTSRFMKKSFIKRRRLLTILLKYGVCLAALLLVLDLVIFPLPINNLSRQQAHFIYDRDGKLLNCFSSSDRFWRKSVALKDVSPDLIKTVISYEEKSAQVLTQFPSSFFLGSPKVASILCRRELNYLPF